MWAERQQSVSPENKEPTNTEIVQALKIIEYDGTTTETTDSLTLGKAPANLKLKLISNCLSNSIEAQISINYAAFSSVDVDEGGVFLINGGSFSEGVNPISLKVNYPDGQVKTSCATLEINSSIGNLWFNLSSYRPGAMYYVSNSIVSFEVSYYSFTGTREMSLESVQINSREVISDSASTVIESGADLRKINFTYTGSIEEGKTIVYIRVVKKDYTKMSASWYFYYDKMPPTFEVLAPSYYGDSMTLRYNVYESVSPYIYNVIRQVKDLNNNVITDLSSLEYTGHFSDFVDWDLKNNSGDRVANGTYLFYIQANDLAGNIGSFVSSFEVH